MGNKTRRDFLKTLGAGSALLPVLPSLLVGSEAEAATTPPMRVIIIMGFNGMYDSVFWPGANPSSQVASGVYATPLSQISGPLSGVLGSAFDPVRNKFSVVRGLCASTSPYGADNIVHDWVSVLACSNIHENNDAYGFEAPMVGSTVDAVIANSTSVYPTTPVLRALRISGGDAKWSGSFYRPNGGNLPPYSQVSRENFIDHDPAKVFAKLFPAGFKPSFASQTLGFRANAVAAPNQRGNVFNALLSRLGELTKSPALSISDRERMQTHTDMLSDLKDRVVASAPTPMPTATPRPTATPMPTATPRPGATPAPTPRPTATPQPTPAPTATPVPGGTAGSCSPKTPGSNLSIPAKYDANFDSIVAAFSCDTTRVVMYTIDNFDDEGKITWDQDHANSHGELGNSAQNCATWRGWQGNRVASLMKKLDSVKDIDGVSTLLDNTIIVWSNQHGGGHCISNYPTIVGGGTRFFRQGLYLDYRNRAGGVTPQDRTLGRPQNNLWHSVMRAMGVPAAEYLKHGEDGGFGQKLASYDSRYVGGDGKVLGFGGNLAQMRREFLPYFYTGT